ncbi:hypothetical protein HMI54_003743 [Coelomomyces lativittatus]|nr:hypothetical protein HMI54_003743 [Coelomomyces lativittatus]
MCGLKNGLSQPYGWAVNVEYDIPNSNIPLYPSSTVSEAIRVPTRSDRATQIRKDRTTSVFFASELLRVNNRETNALNLVFVPRFLRKDAFMNFENYLAQKDVMEGSDVLFKMFTSLNEIYDIGKEMNFLSAFNDWGNAALVSSEEEDADDDNGDGEGDDDDFPFDNDDGGRFRLSRDEVLKGVLIHEPGDEYQSGEEESHDPSVIETLHQSRNPLNHPQGQFGEGREGHSRNPLNHQQGQFGEGREGHSRNPLNHQQGQFGEGREDHSKNPLNHQQGQFGEGGEGHSRNALNHPQGQFEEGREDDSRNPSSQKKHQVENNQEDVSRKQVHHPQRQLMNFGSSKEVGEPIKANDVPPCNRKTKLTQ